MPTHPGQTGSTMAAKLKLLLITEKGVMLDSSA